MKDLGILKQRKMKIKIKEFSILEILKTIALIIIWVCGVIIANNTEQFVSFVVGAEIEFINENDYVQN